MPTCRLDNQPYDAESEATQHYVIDGFILSPNVSRRACRRRMTAFASPTTTPCC
ncbi:MAG: hypothetical protein ACLUNO_13905 [Oscillospiraceae bacterium]